jgi:hypothetical protein
MTDTQTAFVLVPRSDLECIVNLERYRRSGGPAPEDLDGLDDGINEAVHIAANLLSAAPKRPESEIGPVVDQLKSAARKVKALKEYTTFVGAAKTTLHRLVITNEAAVAVLLNNQARIDADAAIIAALRAKIEAQEELDDTVRGWLRFHRERAEAAEARLKELGEVGKGLELHSVAKKLRLQKDAGIPHLPTDMTYEARMAITGDGPRAYEWSDKKHRVVYALCREIERIAALASKKEAADV